MKKDSIIKKIWAIWAEDDNHLIGADTTLPWHLPADLAHFKETTMGATILMGRTTFEGMNRRLLPGRKTLVLTRDRDYQVEGAHVLRSVDEVLDWFDHQDDDLYIIGGASVFESFADYFDGLIRTTIHASFKGDTYMIPLDYGAYKLIEEHSYEKDSRNAHNFTIARFVKKNKE